MSRCLINGCNSTPSGFSASGLCPVHHEAAIRLRLVVPGARASANALRVILAVELAERCRREHAALPEMHERLRQADRRAEEQAAEIGTLRAQMAEEKKATEERALEIIGYLQGRIKDLALERAAEVSALRERLEMQKETIRIEAERERVKLLQRANEAEEREQREVAQAWSLTEAERDGLRARVEELQRLPPVATYEDGIAQAMISLQELADRTAQAEAEAVALREQLVAAKAEAREWSARAEQAQQRQEATICRMSDRTVEKMAETRTRLEEAVEQRVAAEAERDALREQLVAAERRVKGAEAEAATLRRLRGAPAPDIGRRPADSGRRVL